MSEERTQTGTVHAVPVAPSERILSLDVLRGFAVLGILVMNIQSFSMIGAAYLNPTAYGDLTGLNRLVWTLSHLFADTKFLSIFSMLYGAGIVLLATRLREKGLGAAGVHYRRSFWLLIVGLAHGYLLWHGDILACYALVSLVAFLFWRVRPLPLLIVGLLVFSVSPLLYWMGGNSLPYWPPEFREEMLVLWKPGADVISAELAAFRSGWSAQMSERVPAMTEQLTMVFGMYMLWRTLGLMLVGMALYKWGVFSAKRSNVFYAVTAVVGFAAGLPLIWTGIVRRFAAGWSIEYAFFQGAQFNYWGSLLVALAYVACVMLAAKLRPGSWFSRTLSPVGRMAFTNYLLQTVICTLLFYGHGFGLFGTVPRVGQILIVFAVWVVLIWFSGFWLKRFRFGPAEWLWRTLTYMRPQKMRV